MNSSQPVIVSTETDNSTFSAEFNNNINITSSNANNLIKQVRYIKQGKLQKNTSNILKQSGGSSNRFYKFTKNVPCHLSINENTIDGQIVGLDTHNNAIINTNNNTHLIKLHNNLKINNGDMYGGTVLSITSTEQQSSNANSSRRSSNKTSASSSTRQSHNTSASSSTRQSHNTSASSSIYTPISSVKSDLSHGRNIFSISDISSVNISSNEQTSLCMNTTDTDIPNNTSFNSSITEIKSSDKSIHGMRSMRGGNNVSTRAGFLNMDSNSVNSYFSESSSAAESGLCD
jgi:hypothetical protein